MSRCTFVGLPCFTAQVWVYICMYGRFFVQVVSGFTALQPAQLHGDA